MMSVKDFWFALILFIFLFKLVRTYHVGTVSATRGELPHVRKYNMG